MDTSHLKVITGLQLSTTDKWSRPDSVKFSCRSMHVGELNWTDFAFGFSRQDENVWFEPITLPCRSELHPISRQLPPNWTIECHYFVQNIPLNFKNEFKHANVASVKHISHKSLILKNLTSHNNIIIIIIAFFGVVSFGAETRSSLTLGSITQTVYIIKL